MSKWKISILILSTSSFLYVYFHTNKLETTYHAKNLGEGSRTLKIAHVTDLHSDRIGQLEEQLIKKINEEKPDLILITGDLAKRSGEVVGYEKLLKSFKATKGVYFVYGNWEHWESKTDFNQVIKDAGVINLTNTKVQIEENLWLIGFDDSEEGTPDLEILKNLPLQSRRIALFHSPKFFEKVSGQINLGFSGHSHGGQIRLPFLGSLWTPKGVSQYISGWFKNSNSEMYVSRGIGTSILPIRFNCSPELAIINLQY